MPLWRRHARQSAFLALRDAMASSPECRALLLAEGPSAWQLVLDACTGAVDSLALTAQFLAASSPGGGRPLLREGGAGRGSLAGTGPESIAVHSVPAPRQPAPGRHTASHESLPALAARMRAAGRIPLGGQRCLSHRSGPTPAHGCDAPGMATSPRVPHHLGSHVRLLGGRSGGAFVEAGSAGGSAEPSAPSGTFVDGALRRIAAALDAHTPSVHAVAAAAAAVAADSGRDDERSLTRGEALEWGGMDQEVRRRAAAAGRDGAQRQGREADAARDWGPHATRRRGLLDLTARDILSAAASLFLPLFGAAPPRSKGKAGDQRGGGGGAAELRLPRAIVGFGFAVSLDATNSSLGEVLHAPRASPRLASALVHEADARAARGSGDGAGTSESSGGPTSPRGALLADAPVDGGTSAGTSTLFRLTLASRLQDALRRLRDAAHGPHDVVAAWTQRRLAAAAEGPRGSVGAVLGRAWSYLAPALGVGPVGAGAWCDVAFADADTAVWAAQALVYLLAQAPDDDDDGWGSAAQVSTAGPARGPRHPCAASDRATAFPFDPLCRRVCPAPSSPSAPASPPSSSTRPLMPTSATTRARCTKHDGGWEASSSCAGSRWRRGLHSSERLLSLRARMQRPWPRAVSRSPPPASTALRRSRRPILPPRCRTHARLGPVGGSTAFAAAVVPPPHAWLKENQQ